MTVAIQKPFTNPCIDCKECFTSLNAGRCYYCHLQSLRKEAEAKAQEHYFDCPLACDLDNTFFKFMLKHNLKMEFLQQDCNGLPEYRIKGSLHSLNKFIDIVYDCGLQEENDYYKTFIKKSE